MATQTIDIRVVDKASRSLGRIEQRLNSMGKSLGGLSRLAGAATAALGAIGGVKLIAGTVNTIRKFEDLSAQLKTVTGSARLASVALGEIQKFAAQTPFTVDEVTNAFVILKRNGIDATTDSLRAFGNIAAANNKTFTQFGEAVADALTGEFERLKEFGIKVTKENGKFVANLGNQQLGIADTTTELIDLIKELGEEGGRFGEGIENRAQTLSGALSNLQDANDKLLVAFGEGGARTALTELAKTFTSISQAAAPLAKQIGEDLGFAIFKLNEFIRETNFDMGKFVEAGKIAIAVLGGAGLVAVLGKVTAGIKTLTLAIARNPFGILAVAAASLITYLSMENGLGRTIAQVSAVANKLGEVFSRLGAYVRDVFIKIIQSVTQAFDNVVDSVIGFINATSEFLGFEKLILTTSKELRGELGELAVEGYEKVSEAIDSSLDSVVDYVSGTDLAKAAMSEANGILKELTLAYQDAGLSYDEAEAKARAQYEAMIDLNTESKKTPATQNEIQQAMGATASSTAKATKEVKAFQEQLKKDTNLLNIFELERQVEEFTKTYKDARKELSEGTFESEAEQFAAIEALELSFLNTRAKMYQDYLDNKDKAYEKHMENQILLENRAAEEVIRGLNKQTLVEMGRDDRRRKEVRDYIAFEKKSEAEKYQFLAGQASSFFSDLASVNKKFARAAKIAAIAEATVNTYVGATKALASYPPPFNFIAAAAVVASGLAQVAAIRAQPMQRGGALQVGQSTLVGEDGPELIVPKQPGTVIPREVASAIEGMSGNQGPVTVNFNIETVDAEGFDELLISRRGTITGIINQAMQQRGRQGVV